MAALDFPNSPTNGQQYTAPNGAIYTWDGTAWIVSGVLSTGSAAGGDLAGTYPNPTVIPAAKSKWTTGATALTPTDSTKSIVVPTRVDVSPRGALLAAAGYSEIHANNVDDTSYDNTKPSYLTRLNYATDQVEFWRFTTAGGWQSLFSIRGSDGKTFCSLGDQTVNSTMLAVGATMRQKVTAAIPVNFSNVTVATWIKIVDLPAITVRAGSWILVQAILGGFITVSPTGGVIYLGVFRNGGVVYQVISNVKSPTTANTQMPIPFLQWWDSEPAGTYTYSIYMYQGANVLLGTYADSTGLASAVEFT